MNQGARDANAESASQAARNDVKEVNQRLDTIELLLFRILEELKKPLPEHLWPRQ